MARRAAAGAELRLTLVIGSLDRGGTERQVVELVRSAHPRHAICTVVCLSHRGPLADEVNATGASVVSIGLNRPWKLWRLPALARALRRARPDAVYAMLFWGYGLGLTTAAVATPRAVRIAGRRSRPADDRPRHALWLPVRRLADRCSHLVIANSRAGADAWLREAPRLAGKMRVVPNGVRVPVEPARPPEGPLRIVCVANLIRYKGHDVLLESLARLPRDVPEWRVVLIGDGPEREALRAQASRLGLDERVELIGQQADVDRFLRTASLAVLPSRGEGMPNSVLEAMAHGVPVVASAVGGVPELLGSGAGLLVEPDNPVALAAALGEMLRNPELRRAAATEGRRLAEEVFAIPRMRDATLQLVDELLDVRLTHHDGAKWSQRCG